MFTPFLRSLLSLVIVASMQNCISAQKDNSLLLDDHYSLSQSMQEREGWHECESRLLLNALKAKKIESRCINTRSLNADSIRAGSLSLESSLCLPSVISESVCARNISTTNLCATGTVQVANLLNCSLYVAEVSFLETTTYILGTEIPFDKVVYDPNNNVSTVPFFSYTTPVSGYYAVTLELDSDALRPFTPDPILGTPVADPQILVNGIAVREAFTPFLTFVPLQRSNISSIIHLDAGDIVTAQYNVLALNQFGLAFVAGTTEFPDGSGENKSRMLIHMLSVDCDNGLACPTPCTPCTPQVTCTPIVETCIYVNDCCPNLH